MQLKAVPKSTTAYEDIFLVYDRSFDPNELIAVFRSADR